jgi:hypothetical protein
MDIRIYDKPGATDRYSVVLPGWGEAVRGTGQKHILAVAANPKAFSEFTTGNEGRHLGRRVRFEDLPQNLRHHIRQRIAA